MPSGMEIHPKVEDEDEPRGFKPPASDKLCALCSASIHLDVSGKLNAGRMIWLPDVSQGVISTMVTALGIIVLDDEISDKEKAEATKIYENLKQLSEPLSKALGGGTPMEQFTHPLWFWQHAGGRPAGGVRFLPDPNAFFHILSDWHEVFRSNHNPSQWPQLMSSLSRQFGN
jgi:hypothetical protein